MPKRKTTKTNRTKRVSTRIYFAQTEGKGQDRKVIKIVKRFDKRIKGLTGVVKVGKETFFVPVTKADTERDLFEKRLALKRDREKARVLTKVIEQQGYFDHVSIGGYWKKLDKPWEGRDGKMVTHRYAERKVKTRTYRDERQVGKTTVKEFQYQSSSNVPQTDIFDKALGLNELKDRRKYKNARVYVRMDFKGKRGKDMSYFVQGKMGQAVELSKLRKERFRLAPHLKHSDFYKQYGVVAELIWAMREQARRNNWFFSGATFRPQKWTGKRYHTIRKFNMYVRVEYDKISRGKKR